ncbi:hypothetical protein ElyMa_006795100 [Elysia marginata]|uniref:Uncharacterized protein n=1 Tax=Elysia marginata TaxID=1093978 RepID=A0AAV4J287_9GAST|nr:hypothetical protein ElyMa_006795100 [Elysia marginata]
MPLQYCTSAKRIMSPMQYLTLRCRTLSSSHEHYKFHRLRGFLLGFVFHHYVTRLAELVNKFFKLKRHQMLRVGSSFSQALLARKHFVDVRREVTTHMEMPRQQSWSGNVCSVKTWPVARRVLLPMIRPRQLSVILVTLDQLLVTLLALSHQSASTCSR